MSTPGTALRESPFTFPTGYASSVADMADLPAPASKPFHISKMLTQEDVEEIRRLRGENPKKWSVEALRTKFGCTSVMVMHICKKVSKEKGLKKAHWDKKMRNIASWGKRKREAMDARQRRKEMWLRDE